MPSLQILDYLWQRPVFLNAIHMDILNLAKQSDLENNNTGTIFSVVPQNPHMRV